VLLMKQKRFFVLTGLVIALGFASGNAFGNPLSEGVTYYQPLMDRLVQDGFDLERLTRVFLDPRAEIMPELMTLSLGTVETAHLYRQFFEPELLLQAKDFLRKNQKILEKAEMEFKVEKEIIVAILLVESRFGENIGSRRVVPSLASMALMDLPEHLFHNYLILQSIDPEISYEWVERRAQKKANWAYYELKCFLKIIDQEKIDPLEVRGSYAGALGMAQFIPSSYLAFAWKEISFEQWLISKEGGIFSIGNYLKIHGWKENLSPEKKKKVLWTYNHSEPYVDTVWAIAQQLKPKTPPRGKKVKKTTSAGFNDLILHPLDLVFQG
jgi:membrane-bound lytic murein transglycosylase B